MSSWIKRFRTSDPRLWRASPSPHDGVLAATFLHSDHYDIGARIVAAVGEAAAQELLDAITRQEADRAALIGRLAVSDNGEWLAEVLTDPEIDEVARLHMVEALRRSLGWIADRSALT